MKAIKADAWLAACVIVGALVYLYSDMRMPVARLGDALGPRAFPALIGCGLVLAGVLLLVETRNKARGDAAAAAHEPHAALDNTASARDFESVADEMAPASAVSSASGTDVGARDSKHQTIILIAMVAWTAIYYTCFEPVGYLVSTVVFLGGLLSYFHRKHYLTNLLVTLCFACIVDLLFSRLLNVPLPAGILSI